MLCVSTVNNNNKAYKAVKLSKLVVQTAEYCRQTKGHFHFNGIVAKRSVSIVSMGRLVESRLA